MAQLIMHVNILKQSPHKCRHTKKSVCLLSGYFHISVFGTASTVHAQCCVVVVVIVVLNDITIDVYNYRPLKDLK